MALSGVVKSFGHLGMVVPDLEASRKYWTETLGAPTTDPSELVPGLLISFVELGNAQIELIQPVNKESPHYKWLMEHPQGGIHHFSLNTDKKLEDAVAEVEKKGMKCSFPEPVVLSTGKRVTFFDPATTGGALTEFYEE